MTVMDELELADLRGLDESLEMVPRTLYPFQNLKSVRDQIRSMIGIATHGQGRNAEYLAALAERLEIVEAQIAAADRRRRPR